MEERQIAIEITPLEDRVVIRPQNADEVSKGGVILPSATRQPTMIATVLAVGEGRYTEDGRVVKMYLNTGDKVIYSKYAGTNVKIGDSEELILIRQSDVLAVIRETEIPVQMD